MKKVLVCGGRQYADTFKVFEVLDGLMNEYEDTIFVIQGGATGADQRAKEWAEVRGMPCAEVKALWKFYDKSAGPRRNEWMLALAPDLVLAFPGGRGTADMVRRAELAGVPVREISG